MAEEGLPGGLENAVQPFKENGIHFFLDADLIPNFSFQSCAQVINFFCIRGYNKANLYISCVGSCKDLIEEAETVSKKWNEDGGCNVRKFCVVSRLPNIPPNERANKGVMLGEIATNFIHINSKDAPCTYVLMLKDGLLYEEQIALLQKQGHDIIIIIPHTTDANSFISIGLNKIVDWNTIFQEEFQADCRSLSSSWAAAVGADLA